MIGGVRVAGLRVCYGAAGRPVLAVDDLRIPAGQRVALIGPSGAGKTTLLRALHGLAPCDAGEIAVGGVALGTAASRSRAFRRRSAAVFQEFQLVERASVLGNVLHGRLGHAAVLPSLFGIFSEADLAAARRAVAATGLAPIIGRRVDTLSGGQRQRVAVARALAQGPEMITADEPVSNLDPVLAGEILGLVMDAARTRAITALAVVHDAGLAAGCAERVLGLVEGRIVHDSERDGPVGVHALRRIYGRRLPPRIVRNAAEPADGIAHGLGDVA